MIKAVTTVATMIITWLLSIPQQIELAPEGFGVLAVLVTGSVVLVQCAHEIWVWLKNLPETFNQPSEIYAYMCKIIEKKNPAIFSVDMSYSKDPNSLKALKMRANDGDLTLFLPRPLPLSEELKKLGATVYIYGTDTLTPKSRFTIVRHKDNSAELYYGHEKDERFVIERFTMSDRSPAFFLASDLLEIIKHHCLRQSTSTR
ncbi:hypothetical protein [Roseicella aquatilis]|uniref:Uncharacterized protein n=1 Tax=Roseicella aquatilis TaxID=2527868 RepID=A0A4R4D9F4_9PROT|nr:hypothetical protein [Roseicella aquatilis]TCZ56754.1 hypothetical protein EXY23_19410 [Roseicella aquatilis]